MRDASGGFGRPSGPGGISSRVWWVLGILLLVIIVIPSIFAETVTDWMWFSSLNLESVYTTRLWLGLAVFAVAAVLAALICWFNWTYALRVVRPTTLYPGQNEPVSRDVARVVILIASLAIGLFMGLAA